MKPTFEYVSGVTAAQLLRETGLLDEAADEVEMPFLPAEVLEVVASSGGFVLLGYYDDEPIGYVAGQKHYAGHYETHLFVHQAWTKGRPEWSREALAYLEKIAQVMGIQAIGTTVPLSMGRALQRRHGFTPVGTYMMKRLTRSQ